MSVEPPFKKFIAFRYDTYYPAGGLGDIEDSFDTLEEAIKFQESEYIDFREIVDRDTWKTVWDADLTKQKTKEKP